MLARHHSGKLREHRHTSFAGLFFVLMLAGVLLAGMSLSAWAAEPAENPQSGSIGLNGRVAGPPPTVPATIASPRNGDHTSSPLITVAGSCPRNTYVSITKNGLFAGVAACADDGTFSLVVDLAGGRNDLIALITDMLGQSGPSSQIVTVFYDAPQFTVSNSAATPQLFIEADTAVVAVSPGQAVTRTVRIVGGKAPYAVSWDWGDGTEPTLMSQAGEGPVRATHIYPQAGTYRVTVRVTDNQGFAAFLQLITVVNGPAEVVGINGGAGKGALPGQILTAWPLFGVALGMVLLFWLGQRVELMRLRRQNRLIEPGV